MSFVIQVYALTFLFLFVMIQMSILRAIRKQTALNMLFSQTWLKTIRLSIEELQQIKEFINLIRPSVEREIAKEENQHD